eukprot:ANDGO_08428.mRNA.1 hypothetical protein
MEVIVNPSNLASRFAEMANEPSVRSSFVLFSKILDCHPLDRSVFVHHYRTVLSKLCKGVSWLDVGSRQKEFSQQLWSVFNRTSKFFDILVELQRMKNRGFEFRFETKLLPEPALLEFKVDTRRHFLAEFMEPDGSHILVGALDCFVLELLYYISQRTVFAPNGSRRPEDKVFPIDILMLDEVVRLYVVMFPENVNRLVCFANMFLFQLSHYILPQKNPAGLATLDVYRLHRVLKAGRCFLVALRGGPQNRHAAALNVHSRGGSSRVFQSFLASSSSSPSSSSSSLSAAENASPGKGSSSASSASPTPRVALTNVFKELDRDVYLCVKFVFSCSDFTWEDRSLHFVFNNLQNQAVKLWTEWVGPAMVCGERKPWNGKPVYVVDAPAKFLIQDRFWNFTGLLLTYLSKMPTGIMKCGRSASLKHVQRVLDFIRQIVIFNDDGVPFLKVYESLPVPKAVVCFDEALRKDSWLDRSFTGSPGALFHSAYFHERLFKFCLAIRSCPAPHPIFEEDDSDDDEDGSISTSVSRRIVRPVKRLFVYGSIDDDKRRKRRVLALDIVQAFGGLPPQYSLKSVRLPEDSVMKNVYAETDPDGRLTRDGALDVLDGKKIFPPNLHRRSMLRSPVHPLEIPRSFEIAWIVSLTAVLYSRFGVNMRFLADRDVLARYVFMSCMACLLYFIFIR